MYIYTSHVGGEDCLFCGEGYGTKPTLIGTTEDGLLDLFFVCEDSECRESIPTPFLFTHIDYLKVGE